MNTKRVLVKVMFSLFFAVFVAASAQAETTTCTAITSLPKVITAPGVYCLTGDLTTSMTSGKAIEIQANNVVLDLNGHRLGGLAAGAGTQAYGIYAYQRQNITIRNGTVRGFVTGIYLDDAYAPPYTTFTSQGHIIEEIRADMNTNFGMLIVGRGNIVRNNVVMYTGGTTLNAGAYGIDTFGPGNRVINNDVYETKEQTGGVAYAIFIQAGQSSVVANNRVGNLALGPGTSTGIQVYASFNVSVKDNSISMMYYGIYFSSSTGLYMNNLTSGCSFPFTGGTVAGSTNFSN